MKDQLIQIKKWLYTLSGDDYTIIRDCDEGRQRRFAAIGVFVLLILIMCFVGSFVTFYKVFNSISIGLFVSLFFSFVIINIYILMIYTLTRNTLPHKSTVGSKLVSVIIRGTFVAFIAVVVSKPIETILYKSILDEELTEYKRTLLKEFSDKTNQFFVAEIQRQASEANLLKNLALENSRESGVKFRMKLQQEKKEMVDKMAILISKSNFYVQSLVLLSKRHPTSWLVTLLSVLIFLSPMMLKNLVSENADYYVKKKEKDLELVIREYNQFKSDFCEVIKVKYGYERNYCEVYEDPPFNTELRKDPRTFAEEKLLIEEIYND